MKEKEHLPLYGAGPFCVYSMAGLFVLALILRHLGYLQSGEIPVLRIPFRILGIAGMITGLVMWLRAVFGARIADGIRTNHLVTTGVYAWVRNPIYSAAAILLTGASLLFANLWLLLLPVLFWLDITLMMKYTEEKWLYERYGEEFTMYCKKVNRCIPWFPGKQEEKREFSGVQDTLFIPLAARVTISERFPEYFYDEMSMKFRELEQVRAIRAKSSEYSAIASVARYYNMDRSVREFLKQHPDGNVVNLGAGLDTVNYRIGESRAHFYSVDFPDVIQRRESILGRAENETQIGCDITDLRWTKQLDPEKPAFFIASGVFQYFQPEAVQAFLQNMKEAFPKGEMLFDATNEVGIRYARRYVKKSGNQDAMMYFYVNDPREFAEENHVTLLQTRGFFAETRQMLGKRMGLYTRVAMKVADEKNRTLLLHIRFR